MKTAVDYLVYMYALQGAIYQDDIDKAFEIQKEQIIEANRDGVDMVIQNKYWMSGETYYTEIFKRVYNGLPKQQEQ